MKFRPSAYEQLEACPRFEPNPEFDDDAAEEGRLLHECVAKDTTDGLDDEQKAVVEACLRYKKLLAPVRECTVYHELSFEDGGTADFVRLCDGVSADLIDWKFGRLPVTDAGHNPQIQAYVVKIFKRWSGVQQVDASVVCPRQESSSSAVFVRSDIPRIEARIAAIKQRQEDPHAKESPNEKACRMCGRKASCAALGTVVASVCKAAGFALPTTCRPESLLLPADRARAQILSYVLEDWCAQVRKSNAEAAMRDGVKIPGFEVRTRQGSASIENVPAAFTILKEAFAIMPTELLDACKVSVTKLIDVVHAVLNGGGKRVSKDSVRADVLARLAEHVKRNEQVVYLQRVKGITDEEIIQGRV